MKPPLIRLRMGDLYGQKNKELLGFLKSLSYTFPDNGTWEVRQGYQVPKNIDVTVAYQVLHHHVPDSKTSFYPLSEKKMEWDGVAMGNEIAEEEMLTFSGDKKGDSDLGTRYWPV